METYTKALIFAAKAHHGKYRKGSGLPYIVHPIAVAALAHERGWPEHVVVACLLHDTVEDTATTIEDVRAEFGEKVARIVAALTRDDDNETYAELIIRIKTVGESPEAIDEQVAAKDCDVSHNLSDLPVGHRLRKRYERALTSLRA